MTELHPLERFPNATHRVTLPMTGVEVLIRKLDIGAITVDCTRTVLSVPAMREAAQAFAAQAAKQLAEPGRTARPRGELPPEIALEIQRESERGILRSALLRPTLDELVSLYGGRPTDPDLGLGPDYSALVGAIDAFSGAKAGDAEKERAQAFPVAARLDAAYAGEGLQLPSAPVAED